MEKQTKNNYPIHFSQSKHQAPPRPLLEWAGFVSMAARNWSDAYQENNDPVNRQSSDLAFRYLNGEKLSDHQLMILKNELEDLWNILVELRGIEQMVQEYAK